MYHADKYKESNDSLKRFCDVFNATSAKLGGEIIFDISQKENFRDDGKIIYKPTNEIILFDWEKRHTYYGTCGGFNFKTFGQFERKMRKVEIRLSIQCSTDEKCFIIAWHDDFKKEAVETVGSVTASGSKEYDGKRFTTKFKEISYQEMEIFYNILSKAFVSKNYDATTF